MAAITTVATAGAGATVKGALLTNAEVDANLLNINDELFVDALPVVRPSLLLDFLNQDALDSRVTFARASTATYYDGRTVAKAEQNLLPSAGDLSSWGGGSLTITGAATTAPDGSNTGARITAPANSSGSFGLAHSTLVLSAGTYTFSVYVKADIGVTWVYLRFDQGNDRVASFNLSTGTVGTVHADYASAAMTSVGNGWFRCSVTRNSAGNWSNAFYFYFGPASADATSGWSGSASASSFFAWGAQLEQRSSPGLFVPATTYVPRLVTAPAGVPRFTFDPTTSEPVGLLVEEQRTNLLVRSAEFDDGAWTKSWLTVLGNDAVAPDGSVTADRVTAQTGGVPGTAYRLYQGPSLTAGQVVTSSIFFKAGLGVAFLTFGADQSAGNAYFNTATGAVSGNLTASCTPVGNGWFRAAVTYTVTANDAVDNQFWSLSDRAFPLVNAAFAGGEFLFLWGAQLEVGASATSYIPTAAAQVTRAADDVSMSGANFSSWYRQAEGSWALEYQWLGGVAGSYAFTVGGSSGNQFYAYGGGSAQLSVEASGANQAVLTAGAFVSGPNRVSLAYSANDFAATLNGSVAATDNSGSVPSADRLQIGRAAYGAAFPANVAFRRLAYYPKRLSNTELRALTL